MTLPAMWCMLCVVGFLASFIDAMKLPTKHTDFYTGRDPDSCTDIEALITSKGYPFESHSVVTSDGYIIEVHRIPHGREPCVGCHRHPVFLMSGLIADSSSWVLDFPKQSLGFFLADHQYDVWMGNVRGSTYGIQHQILSKRSSAFWNFSFHEHALLDLPAQIDYVLHATETTAIHYIGVSQGTLILFTLLSERPEYNQKVKVFVGLAPFNKLSHMDVAVLSTFAPAAKTFLSSSYDHVPLGLMTRGSFLSSFLKTFCGLPTRSICSRVGDTFMNLGSKYVNQLVTSKKAQKFDYGPKKNMAIYGQKEPGLYNIDNVKTDVGIFWSRGDQFVPPDNVRELLEDLGPRVKINHFIDDPDYTHFNFNVAMNNPEVLYPVLLSFLDKYGSGS